MNASFRKIGNSFIADSAAVIGNVELGAGVNIWFQSVVRGDLARISFGPRVNLQDACVVHTDFEADMVIEEGVVVGHSAVLHGNRIGRNTLIGIGARLLSGSEIGEDCLIAAGSLIVQGAKIPPGSVVMGSPGKVVRRITDADLTMTHTISARYLELAKRYAAGNDPSLRSL